MKKKYYIEFLVIIISLIMIVVSNKMINKYESAEAESVCELKLLKNCLAVSVSNNKLTAVYNNELLNFYISEISEDISNCLCDLVVDKDEVYCICTKKDTINGKVLSVSNDSIWIEGYGEVELDEDFVVYDNIDTCSQTDISDIIVGYSLQDFIVANKKICGAIINKNINVDKIRVLLTNTGFSSIFHSDVIISSEAGMIIKDISNDEVLKTFGPGEKCVLNNQSSILNNRIRVESVNRETKVESINRSYGNPVYEGTLEIEKRDEGLIIVNEVDIEDYLKKVVPSEMPSGFNIEALKCQAVCARSYAYSELKNDNYSIYGAHVDDSTLYQVYNNSQMKESTNEAIKATKGQVLTYNDNVIRTYYYSTSCGSTTDVSLWGSDAGNYPYFVAECVSSNSKNKVLSIDSEFEKFIKTTNENDYDYGCNLYRWDITLGEEIIRKSLIKFGFKDIGEIKDIKVSQRIGGGAVTKVLVKGSKGEVEVSGEALIRSVFGDYGTIMHTTGGDTNYASLPSTFFIIEKITNKGGKTEFKITGGGYGHGIGMSQNAANAMAKTHTYDEILKFFYPKTNITVLSS